MKLMREAGWIAMTVEDEAKDMEIQNESPSRPQEKGWMGYKLERSEIETEPTIKCAMRTKIQSRTRDSWSTNAVNAENDSHKKRTYKTIENIVKEQTARKKYVSTRKICPNCNEEKSTP